MMRLHPTRRSVLTSILTLPSALALPLNGQAATPPLLEPTPSCGGRQDLTTAQTQGPFYTPEVPLKHDLSGEATGGSALTLAGFVLDRQCQPLPDMMVEIWHADQNGDYDNEGHRLRGHQFTDQQGRWGFSTIVTHHYSFRTAHYHFRVSRQDGSILTTQLYFPDYPRNAGDRLFDPRLVLAMGNTDEGPLGRFDFVV